MLKKVLSLLLALTMVASAMVFCAAETEIKVDVRLEEKENGYVDMVFSIPENADLAEFSFDVYYHSAAIIVDGEGEPTFKSNLSQEEEEIVTWQIETDYQNLDASYGEYPCCFISGYTKVGEGLNAGGDLFTLTFKLIEGVPDENYVFNIETDFITNANGDFYTEAVVPQSINYEVKDASIVSYYVSYTKYIPEVSMDIIDEVSKLAWDYSPTVHREFYDIANDMLFPGEGSFSGSNGGRVYSQGFAPAYKYASEVKVYIRIYGVSHGTDYLTIQIRNAYHDINYIYSNNYPVTATGDRWIGGATTESNGAAKRVALNVNQTYHLAFSYCFPGVAGSACGLVADNVNNSYPMYYSGANQHDAWTRLNGCNAFDINYDSDMCNFDAYVSNMGSSFDVDDESNFNNATTYYNRIKNNAYQWNVINSTIRNNYSSASTAISNAKTKINNFKNAVTAINNGGITISDNSAINSALSAYNSLSTAQKNYSGVSSSKSTLDGYRTTCTNLINGKNNVQTAINNIGTPVTWSKKSTVESARASYNALNQDQKNNVNNYSTLTAAETTISNMQTAGNNFKAAAVAIGTVSYTAESKALIDDARAKYTALEAFNDSTLTGTNWATEHLAILQAAEAEYAQLDSEVVQFREAIANIQPGDMDAVNALHATYEGFTEGQQAAVYEDYTKLLAFSVLDLVDACFPVDIDKLDEIEAAMNAYNGLAPELQALLGTNSEGLTYDVVLANAMSEYNQMVKEVDDLVAAIGALDIATLDFADISYIAELSNTYNELTDIQKNAVSNYDVLVAAGEHITQLQLDVADFKALVESIATIDVDDLNTVVNAETMYAGFTAGQKEAVVAEYQTLVNARQRVDVLIGEVEALDIQISTTIPAENVDVDSTNAVNAANAIYNTFTDAQKELLENEQVLLDAITAVAVAQAKVAAVETVIKNIGNVTYAKKAAVENARAEFEALTDAQKDAVSNISTLLAAEDKIAELEAEITAAEEIINAIGNVDVDKEEAINNAVNAYTALSDTQKEAVENLDVLTTAQETLQSIKDMIDAFEAEIETLYPIDIDDGEIITATEEKYEALTEPQKGIVENYARLTEARATYDKMLTDVATFKATMNDLGEVDLLDEDLETLENSKALYEFFTELQKAEVEAEKVILDDAFVVIDALWQEVYALMDAIDAIGEVTLEDEFAILDCIDIYENQLTVGQQSKVENLSTLLDAEATLNNLKLANSLYGVIVASNDVASTQTVTLNLNAYNSVAGYYFGTSADYLQNAKVETTATTATEEITAAGTYYLNVFDANDNVSEAVSVTFVDVILNANGGDVNVTSIIVKKDNYIALPSATKNGDTFMGWARSENAVAGESIVDVENGGTFYAVWAGESKPSLKVISTNDVATKQTLTFNATTNEGVAGYYFGTSAYYGENAFTKTSKNVSTVDVLDAGTYYVTVLDEAGNVSATIPVTFYKVTLNANSGSAALPYVIVKAGNAINMPEAVNVGYQYLGWSADVDATSGSKTITPTENTTYYAIWTRGISTSATVGSVTGAKAGDRVYIPVSIDRYTNSFASIVINNVIFDKAVLSFVEFSIPENDFISHLSQAPVVNNTRKTYKLTNNPENAVDAYYTSTGVFVILVFDVLQDVNQFTSVSVAFDSKNTAVYTMGSADNWTETKANVDVNVIAGGVYANIDNQKPTAFIASTNNISAIQTITLNMYDNFGVAGYYFGSSEEYANNQYFTDGVAVSKTINASGSYYLTVVDVYGNISETISVTFYSILLCNPASPGFDILLAKEGSEVELPIYEKDGYVFKGWAENTGVDKGEFTITATGDQVLYEIWKSSEEEIQNVIDLIDNIDDVVTLESADQILAARLAYEALTDDQKVLVINYEVLEVAEETIANLSKVVGDIDQSGATESIDALMALQAGVGKLELTDEQFVIADIDGNGVVNAVDSLYILQISVGKITNVK